MSRAGRIALAVAIVGAIGAAIAVLPIRDLATRLIAAVHSAGVAGALGYAAVYVVTTVLLVPASILTVGAGFLYGPLWGTALVAPAAVTAATIAFLLARGWARPWVQRRIAGDRRFRAIDTAIGDRGLRIVTLLRLSPLFPFMLLNYVIGLTRVTLGRYVLGTAVGMLPATFLYVYLGSLITRVSDLGTEDASTGGLRRTAFWVGLAAALLVTLYVTRIARRALAREVPAAQAPGGVDG